MKKLLLPALFLTSFSVFAGTSPSELFKSLDADGNGSLSRTEVAGEARLASTFKDYDADRDGEISSQEFMSYVKSIK